MFGSLADWLGDFLSSVWCWIISFFGGDCDNTEGLPSPPPSPQSVRNLGDYDENADEEYFWLEFVNYKTQVEESRRRFLDVVGERKDDADQRGIDSTKSFPAGDDQTRTAVVYSGPTSLDPNEGKNWMYLKNFEYFLKHGVDCKRHDTYLVLTQDVANAFRHRIRDMREQDCSYDVVILEREDRCYDMESMNVFLNTVDLNMYDYFVYVNCGMVRHYHSAANESYGPANLTMYHSFPPKRLVQELMMTTPTGRICSLLN